MTHAPPSPTTKLPPGRRSTIPGEGRRRISVVLDHQTWAKYHRLMGERSMSRELREYIRQRVQQAA